MKKILFTVLLTSIAICGYSQKHSVSLNIGIKPDPFFAGIDAQGMIDVGKKFYISPNISYYFKSGNNYNKGYNSLNFNIDVHYAIYMNKNGSFISPFVGIGYMHIYYDYNETLYKMYDGYGEKLPAGEGVKYYQKWKWSENYLPINLGLRGQWNLGDMFFINTQLKYSICSTDGDLSNFVFTTGIGLRF